MENTNEHLHKNSNDQALFFGQEQEGPNKGKMTLFVKNKVPHYMIDHYALHVRPEQIYFGAGALSEIDWPSISRILANPSLLVTVETCETFNINLLDKHKNLYIFFTIEQFGKRTGYDSDFLDKLVNIKSDNLYIKLCTGQRVHFFKPCALSNTFDGYPDDKILWSNT